jgi:hypothetical protein
MKPLAGKNGRGAQNGRKNELPQIVRRGNRAGHALPKNRAQPGRLVPLRRALLSRLSLLRMTTGSGVESISTKSPPSMKTWISRNGPQRPKLRAKNAVAVGGVAAAAVEVANGKKRRSPASPNSESPMTKRTSTSKKTNFSTTKKMLKPLRKWTPTTSAAAWRPLPVANAVRSVLPENVVPEKAPRPARSVRPGRPRTVRLARRADRSMRPSTKENLKLFHSSPTATCRLGSRRFRCSLAGLASRAAVAPRAKASDARKRRAGRKGVAVKKLHAATTADVPEVAVKAVRVGLRDVARSSGLSHADRRTPGARTRS